MSKQWTPEERIFLKKNYNIIPLEEICKQLDRTPQAVYRQVYTLRKRGWKFARTGE